MRSITCLQLLVVNCNSLSRLSRHTALLNLSLLPVTALGPATTRRPAPPTPSLPPSPHPIPHTLVSPKGAFKCRAPWNKNEPFILGPRYITCIVCHKSLHESLGIKATAEKRCGMDAALVATAPCDFLSSGKMRRQREIVNTCFLPAMETPHTYKQIEWDGLTTLAQTCKEECKLSSI